MEMRQRQLVLKMWQGGKVLCVTMGIPGLCSDVAVDIQDLNYPARMMTVDPAKP